MPLNRKVRYGMVGGGPGAFIGAVHRKAAAMDGEIELVAGAFSSDAAKSKAQGAALHLDPRRVYSSWRDMVEGEKRLPAGKLYAKYRRLKRVKTRIDTDDRVIIFPCLAVIAYNP